MCVCGNPCLQKYLVLINPMSGPGKSQQIYESTVAPVFQQSNIECEVVITQRQHHATDIVANIPLNIYDCVVSVSGDGLLSESESRCLLLCIKPSADLAPKRTDFLVAI